MPITNVPLEYVREPLMPDDEEGKAIYLANELDKISYVLTNTENGSGNTIDGVVWKSPYVPGDFYTKDTMIFSNFWTMIANKDTTENAVPVGTPPDPVVYPDDWDVVAISGEGGGTDPNLEARVAQNEQDIDALQAWDVAKDPIITANDTRSRDNAIDIGNLQAWETAIAPIIDANRVRSLQNESDIEDLQEWETAVALVIDANRLRSLQNESDIEDLKEWEASIAPIVGQNRDDIEDLQEWETAVALVVDANRIRSLQNESDIDDLQAWEASIAPIVGQNRDDIADLQAWEIAIAPIVGQNRDDIEDLQQWEASIAPIVGQNRDDIEALQGWETATAPIIAASRDEIDRQENITVINSLTYKMLVTDGTVIIDVSSNGVNCILPDIVDVLGKKFTIKNEGGSAGFAVYSTNDGASIDFQPGATGYGLADKESITLQAGTTGNIWYRVGGYKP